MKIRILLIGLLIFLASSVIAEVTGNEESLARIAEVFGKMDVENKYTEMLTYSDLTSLPLGMKKTVSNNEFSVAVSNMLLYDDYVELTMFARIRLNQKEKPLFFAAAGVKMSYDGGFMGDAALVLVGDVEIPVNEHSKIVLHGGNFDLNAGIVEKGKMTSMAVDCSGFRELAIDASLVFSDSFITRVSNKGEPEQEPVSADFNINITDWNNLLVELSLPRFQINGLDGFIFALTDIVFDFSDFVNSSSVVFPSSYKQKNLLPEIPELWRGVYAKKVEVTIPKDFSNEGNQVSFFADNFLIDDNGVSGTFTGENILPVEKGNASGWAFSIDKFWLSMEAHKITSGGFSGLIGLPVSDSGTLLGYDAKIMGNNNYQLNVSLKETLQFDMLLGVASLKPNSSISLKMNDGKFLPEANLHGALTITTAVTASDKGTKLKDIEFRDLCFKTESPYISVGYMGYKGEISVFGLPVSISNIEVKARSTQLDLGFNINLNLDDNFITASTRLNLSSEYTIKNNRGSWTFRGVTLDEVSLNRCEIAGILEITGHVKIMDDDPQFGDGFYGDISLSFKEVIKGLDVSVASAFGRKDGDRYWFVDGSITLPTVIPIVGIFGINGFAGGASMGMRRVSDGGLGKTRTGCGFIPDSNAGLGLKAGVMFKSTGSNLVSGDASFEIIFNKHGGINTVGFYGFVAFTASVPGLDNIQASVTSLLKNVVDKENALVKGSLEKMEALNKKKNDNPSEATKEITDSESRATEANIAAAVGILYTVSEKTLHATFDFYVNVLGGVLRGTGANNRAGWAVLHFSPQKWYIHMGTPSDKLGLSLGIPGIASIYAESYFMLGDEMPDAPDPPAKVVKYISQKGETYSYMRDLNNLQSGRGMAFGASFGFKTGDLTCLILYARFEMEMGFDIMIKDYGAAQCKGMDGPIGINGWYANGQSYAYMEGDLGVKVNVGFIKGRFSIINGGAAALLQSKLPNPTWIGGAIGVQFNILNGLVKGNSKFKFSFGDECEIMYPGSSPIDISMISDLTPAPESSEVDVFTAPQLVLTYPAGESFEFNDEDGTRLYRVSIDKFEIFDDNSSIPGKIKWNSAKTAATFYSEEVLPPQKKLKINIAVGFEEYKNGKWSVVYTSGTKSVETREISFTTGEAPDYIPLHNVEYAYPLIDQKYYYPSEFSHGYIQLLRGQSYLFPSGWNYNVRISEGSSSQTNKFTYDVANKRVNFSMPSLSRSRIFDLNLVTSHSAKSSGSTTNGTKETVLIDDEDSKVVQTSGSAANVLQESGEKSILNYKFSSSKYKLFADKMKKVSIGQEMAAYEGPYIIGLSYGGVGIDEEFEESELFETEHNAGKPLIQAKAVLEGNKYYESLIYPLIYKSYSSSSVRLNREGDAIGIPPVYGFGKWLEKGKFPIRYEVPKYYLSDYGELRNKVVNAGITNNPLYNSAYFPDILSGKYPVTMQYVLPGGDKGSSVEFEYKIQK
ncbi:MAG: hypothetical protein LBR13_06490 [Dysgonamonadaceae bacterium]|jgi:hypothetical protein|nr:hypothetical protein [Dysgonamonadaceae bacterium]